MRDIICMSRQSKISDFFLFLFSCDLVLIRQDRMGTPELPRDDSPES